ncbi:MAG: hypothetical protein KatS3mg077_2159 [Candidatus Binatia bacterium]|nr:MAG: hypothetical protein KatS3mg077_2159 [Candidatus Binatia bacterium]
MAMQVGTPKGKQPAPTINVTPLVDVVLVLLIIFMVVTPLLDRKFWVHTPKQEKGGGPATQRVGSPAGVTCRLLRGKRGGQWGSHDAR